MRGFGHDLDLWSAKVFQRVSELAIAPWVWYVAFVVYGTLMGYSSYRIVKRAGYPGIWTIFWMVPCLGWLFEIGLAFWRWPVSRRRTGNL